MTTPETLYIVDGTYYIFRAFYAMPSLSNSQGMPTNGLFGFTNMLLNLMREHEPQHLIMTFDPPGDTFRHVLYDAYKANRESPPDELRVQMPHFRRIVKALNIPIVEVPTYEADDVIATIVRSPLREGKKVVVLTGDKDLYQLVDEDTELLDSMRGKRVGLAEVLDRFQVGPDKVADVLALAGDTSDNVPGIPGIGEKTAGKLIAEWGSVEALLANIDKVSGAKRKENLTNFAEQARLSLELVTVMDKVRFELIADDAILKTPDFPAFDAICAEFGFGRFPTALRAMFPGEALQLSDAADAERQYQNVWSEAELHELVARLREAGRFALDLETTSLDPLDAEIVGISVSVKPHEAYYIPVGHLDLTAPPQLTLEFVLTTLRPLLEDPSMELIAHNGAYETRVFARYNITLPSFQVDTMLAAFLVDPNRRRYGLDALATASFGVSPLRFEDVAGSGKNQVTFDQVPIERATRYACEDADYTLQLAELLLPQLEDAGMRSLLCDIEVPLAKVLAKMEQVGVRVDVDFLRTLSVEFSAHLERLEAEIYEAAGREFLVSSPAQLRVILFEELELPVIKKTKTGPSTDQEVLEALSDQHPLPALILAHRHYAKLRSTYIEALPRLVHPKSGRVHTSFNQAVAATGRLSSSEPNLQNIPVRSEDGRRIRRAFVPREGWVLLGGDYSQIELRILAHMSEDAVLIDAFVQGEDIHRRTAAEVFEVPTEEVTATQRDAAKAINFGLLYGMGARRLADGLHVSTAEAQRYIDQYFARIEGVKPFLDRQVAQAKERGYAETLAGRRRPIPELLSSNKRISAMGERLAMNTPIQGTAADLIKIAMIRIDERLEAEGLEAKLLIQVHDELVFEAPEAEVDRLQELAREEMESVWTLKVPLRVDFARGPSWAELE